MPCRSASRPPDSRTPSRPVSLSPACSATLARPPASSVADRAGPLAISPHVQQQHRDLLHRGRRHGQGVTAEGDSGTAGRPWLQLTTQETAPRAGRCYPGAVLDPDRHTYTHRPPNTTHYTGATHTPRCTTLDTQNT